MNRAKLNPARMAMSAAAAVVVGKRFWREMIGEIGREMVWFDFDGLQQIYSTCD